VLVDDRAQVLVLDDELGSFVAQADRPPWPVAAGLWDRLRREAPIAWHGPFLVFCRHEDVRNVLRDPRFGKGGVGSTEAEAMLARLSPDDQRVFHELVGFESTWMVRAPSVERHDRLRRIAHRAFTPRQIDALERAVESYTDELLDTIEGDALADITTISYRLPLNLITDMLGVPDHDRLRVHDWTGRLSAGLGRDPHKMRAAAQALHEFRGYVDKIADRHRRNPESVSPLVAAMLDAEQEEQLTPAELAGLIVQLLFAGHETATTLIEQGLIELMVHREQWEMLCGDLSLVPNAVEELLRWVPPVPSMFRVAYESCELAGVPIQAGQSVRVLIAAANRDPAVFEDAERFDVTRANAREHLSFGFGPRFCLGASLARLEVTTAFTKLMERYPRMELAGGEVLSQRGPGLRSLASLPVRLR
jgi:cytochrome P450